MTEPRPVYHIRLIERLNDEQKNQINYALTVLTPAQLAMIALKIKAVCLDPGIGRIYITIEAGHPHLVGVDVAEKLKEEVDGNL
jgi:hypothetical protein